MTATAISPQRLLEHLELRGERAYQAHLALERQYDAIRARDINQVLDSAAALQAIAQSDAPLAAERDSMLADAASRLGCDPEQISLDALTADMDEADADAIRERSSALREALAANADATARNNAMLEQELSFVSLMVQTLGVRDPGTYTPGRTARTGGGSPNSTLDVRG